MGKNVLFFVLVGMIGTSCNTMKYLDEGEKLVVKNTINFSDSSEVKNKSNIRYELGEIVENSGQKPNSKFLGLARTNLWFFYKTNRPQDTTKLDKTFRKLFAEPPTLFAKESCATTANAMKNLMLNKGFLDAEVGYSYKERRKKPKVEVTYDVDAGRQYVIQSYDVECPDPSIDSIVHAKMPETFFKPGTPLDAKIYDKERTRITTDLRNEGYAFFSNQYISTLTADTSDYGAEAYLEIRSQDSSVLRTYRIGEVNIFPYHFGNNDSLGYPVDTIIGGYHFKSRSREFPVKPSTILQKIFFEPGDYYDQAVFDQTYRSLNSLEIFRFVSIKFQKDPVVPGIVHFNIYLIPSKKMVIGADAELNSSDYEGNSNLLGIAGSVLYRNRNLLKGAEIFGIKAEGGLEFNVVNQSGLFSTEANIESDLLLPRYINPYRLGKRKELDRDDQLNLFQRFRKNMDELASSRLSVGFVYLDYQNSYSYYSFNFALGHSIPVSFLKQIQFNRIGIDYFKPISLPSTGGDGTPDDIPELIRQSFTEQLFTGFFFRDISYLSRKTTDRDVTWTFKTNFEVSGLEITAANALYNEFSSSSEVFTFPGDIEYSRYIRAEAEQGWTRQLSPRTALAVRAGVGLAIPYSTSETVPFVKQYYVGGPYSIRGWSLRELGPGSYDQPIDNDTAQPFFQTGDIKFELGLEYRFDMFWIFEGAFFVDGGNVWTLTEESDEDRPGSQFKSDFYRDIAVAAGFGLRFDFSYFIIRLDLGYKVKNTFKTEGQGYWAHPSLSRTLGDANYNLAIGYPF